MSTTPRLASAVEGKQAHARTVMAHSPSVRAAFDRMYATLWSDGIAMELLVAGALSGVVLVAVYFVFIASSAQYYVQEQLVQMELQFLKVLVVMVVLVLI